MGTTFHAPQVIGGLGLKNPMIGDLIEKKNSEVQIFRAPGRGIYIQMGESQTLFATMASPRKLPLRSVAVTDLLVS